MGKDLLKCEHGVRMKGDERREQILATAVRLFSEKGFKGATTKEIARAAGVSEAIIFRHFATKDDLYAAILHDKGCQDGVTRFPWEQNEDLARSISEKDDFAFFYNIALAALNKHHSDVAFMRLLFYSALEEHDLADAFFNNYISRVYEFIGSYIETRQRDGIFRELDPKISVRAFLGMLIHHSLNNILWDRQRALLNISNEDAAREFTEILLNGIRSQGGK